MASIAILDCVYVCMYVLTAVLVAVQMDDLGVGCIVIEWWVIDRLIDGVILWLYWETWEL